MECCAKIVNDNYFHETFKLRCLIGFRIRSGQSGLILYDYWFLISLTLKIVQGTALYFESNIMFRMTAKKPVFHS